MKVMVANTRSLNRDFNQDHIQVIEPVTNCGQHFSFSGVQI